ncbi:MAG: calmodulin [Gammaproteobacteria bacterium]|nr:calmodulin [Gammaproteobacteria bacterium]
MKQTTTIALTALLFSVSSAAMAEEAMDFTAVDADGDGMISAAEAEAVPGLADQLASLDADGDGQLDADEYAKFES